MTHAASIPRADITGLLLAGGLGRRMGGQDKGLVAMGAQPLAQHVLARLRPQVGPLLINANRNLAQWQALGAPVVSDVVGGFSGPLAGLHAGLTACTTPWLVSAPCDSPFLPTDLVQRLAQAAIHHHADVAVARCNGQLHPVFALLRAPLRPSLAQQLQQGNFKIQAWLDRVNTVVVDFPDPHAFANINTPHELDLHSPAAGAARQPLSNS
jgi:molybdopterin-guanine dinucleotide biosynthesis protein A